MFKFKGTLLRNNVTVANSLTSIYGIGLQRSLYVASSFGFSEKYSINFINAYYFECMTVFMSKFFILEDRLRYLIRYKFVVMKDSLNRRYDRYIRGLPIRGQRTHTNSKTVKRNIKYIV